MSGKKGWERERDCVDTGDAGIFRQKGIEGGEVVFLRNGAGNNAESTMHTTGRNYKSISDATELTPNANEP